jgi:hypothetical protein
MPAAEHLATLPESEDELSRRLRIGTSAAIGGSMFGLTGIMAGLVGSQAGQTVREVFGKEGKFEDLGWGEAAALGTDFVFGGITQVVNDLVRNAPRLATQVPAIFRNPETGLQRSITRNMVQSERSALENVINNFGREQLTEFEQAASQISPNRYSQFISTDAAANIQQAVNNMYRNNALYHISPLAVTQEQAGRAIQQAAERIFQANVIQAENAAYQAASQAATGLNGQAPRTLAAARALRTDLLRTTPNPEQDPVIHYLNNLIDDLVETIPASTLVDQFGNPLVAATTRPRTRNANDLVNMVQNGNHAINYESIYREQSHRLKPIINMLREETGTVLNQRPQAAQLYQGANQLHGTNAEIWGTRFMQNVRHGENPETIISRLQTASNMNNFKRGVTDPGIQGVAERATIDKMTQKGSHESNRIAVDNLFPELSPQAQAAANNIIEGKNALTTAGGRMAVVNEILKDAAQAVNTGKRPEKILDLMQTTKGYQLVREAMQATPQTRDMFRSFERLFLEDVFNSILDSSGRIDFNKARNIFKNPEMRDVIRQIGGEPMIRRLTQLEQYGANFERNMLTFKRPEAKNLFRRIIGSSAVGGIASALLHYAGAPLMLTGALGIATGLGHAAGLTFDALRRQMLSNPRVMQALERVSLANSVEQMAESLPRLISEVERAVRDEKKD